MPFLSALSPFCFTPPGLLTSGYAGLRSDPGTCQVSVCLEASVVTNSQEGNHFPYLPTPDSISSFRALFLISALAPQEVLPGVPFFFLFLCFLGLHLRHMEVSRLGVELELQQLAYITVTATRIQAVSATYTPAHGNAGYLTH